MNATHMTRNLAVAAMALLALSPISHPASSAPMDAPTAAPLASCGHNVVRQAGSPGWESQLCASVRYQTELAKAAQESSSTALAPAASVSGVSCGGFGRFYDDEGKATRDMSGVGWEPQLCAGIERANWLAAQK